MNTKKLKSIIRAELKEIMQGVNTPTNVNENITYYVCDGCPTSGATFENDSTCGGGCSGGCTCKEANTGMTTGTGGGVGVAHNVHSLDTQTHSQPTQGRVRKQITKPRMQQHR